MIQKMVHILAHGIGSTLKPTTTGHGLLGGQNIYKRLTKEAEMIRVFDVFVQGSRIKLC